MLLKVINKLHKNLKHNEQLVAMSNTDFDIQKLFKREKDNKPGTK